ncbi:hypothetical protein D3C77_430050 [compost metagenome]
MAGVQMGIDRGDGRQLMGMADPHHEAAHLGQGRDQGERLVEGGEVGLPPIQPRQLFAEGVKMVGTQVRLHQQEALQEEGANMDFAPQVLQSVEPARA